MKHQETHFNGIARKTLAECWKSHLEILKGWLEKQPRVELGGGEWSERVELQTILRVF